ncbi:MAG: flavodoxin FldA [Alphaproteobacteria bacterium]|jgi:flavodoxin I|nr:flavodoxin FldA [Alphaproteobacteria bacterium]
MSVTIVYGSDGGATRAVAARIAKKMNGKAVDIKVATSSDFEDCKLLILGVPTYGEGELQSDWDENFNKLESANLGKKKVALFGLGDQENYPESFLDAMGVLYDQVVEQGAEVIGFTEPGEFTYTNSLAERDGKFVGLALDEDTQPGKTGKRITSWISQLA